LHGRLSGSGSLPFSLFLAELLRCSSDKAYGEHEANVQVHPCDMDAPTRHYTCSVNVKGHRPGNMVWVPPSSAGRNAQPRTHLQARKATLCFPKLAVGTIAVMLPSLILNIWDGYAPQSPAREADTAGGAKVWGAGSGIGIAYSDRFAFAFRTRRDRICRRAGR